MIIWKFFKKINIYFSNYCNIFYIFFALLMKFADKIIKYLLNNLYIFYE